MVSKDLDRRNKENGHIRLIRVTIATAQRCSIQTLDFNKENGHIHVTCLS